ncbi:MAG: BolA/IbaG family iron-sulfur metabolism protein [Pseudomonadota bacterium]|nr:BolA/IbaG family iron-sulfur metabolism protein [Pseudomonadota bacterium]
MNEIIELLKKEIPDSEVSFQEQGSRLALKVSSPAFKQVSRLERQRVVKRLLKPWIDSGALHAVMLTVTDGE